MIYLDNAATSWPKPESVYQAINSVLRSVPGSYGRGGHAGAMEAGRIVFEVRESLADFIGAKDSSRIIFTGSATEAVNIALFGLLSTGDRVVTTSMEHNAVMRPLYALQKDGVEVDIVQADITGWVDPDDIKKSCRNNKPKMVAMTHCSNVTGTIQDVAEVGKFCRENDILFLVDAAQSMGSILVDVESMNIDILFAPGHKGLMGPQGTGFLYLGGDLNPRPLVYGGTGGFSASKELPESLPERYETGTQNLPGIAGLGAGIEWVKKEGISTIHNRLSEQVSNIIKQLEVIVGCHLFGPASGVDRGGIVSFQLDSVDVATVGYTLETKFGIMTRVGLHCAPSAHRTIQSYPQGTIRLSPGPFLERVDFTDALISIIDHQ